MGWKLDMLMRLLQEIWRLDQIENNRLRGIKPLGPLPSPELPENVLDFFEQGRRARTRPVWRKIHNPFLQVPKYGTIRSVKLKD